MRKRTGGIPVDEDDAFVSLEISHDLLLSTLSRGVGIFASRGFLAAVSRAATERAGER